MNPLIPVQGNVSTLTFTLLGGRHSAHYRKTAAVAHYCCTQIGPSHVLSMRFTMRVDLLNICGPFSQLSTKDSGRVHPF
jgi:hypothetical protein